MKSKLTDKDMGYDDMMSAFDEMDGSIVVEVGVPADAGQYEEGANLVMVASVHEYGAQIQHPGGTPYVYRDNGQVQFVSKDHPEPDGVTDPHTIDIPQRSFLRSTMDEKREHFGDMLAKFVGEVLDGKKSPRQALDSLGQEAVKQVRRKITQLDNPPNAPSTARQKGSSNPLVDDGQLKNSIIHRVRQD